jgi:hypothetical protein
LKFCNAKPNIQWMFDGGSREAERTHSVESRARTGKHPNIKKGLLV